MKLDILGHFQFFLGDGQLFSTEQNIDIYKWCPTKDENDVILATVGMAESVQFVPESRSCISSSPRTEIIARCKSRDAKLIARLLLDLANYPNKTKSFIHWWHVLHLGGAIAPDSELSSILFTFPFFDEKFATFEIDGRRIDVVWAIPISDGELAFFESEGADALEQCMEENNTVVADLFRSTIK